MAVPAGQVEVPVGSTVQVDSVLHLKVIMEEVLQIQDILLGEVAAVLVQQVAVAPVDLLVQVAQVLILASQELQSLMLVEAAAVLILDKRLQPELEG